MPFSYELIRSKIIHEVLETHGRRQNTPNYPAAIVVRLADETHFPPPVPVTPKAGMVLVLPQHLGFAKLGSAMAAGSLIITSAMTS